MNYKKNQDEMMTLLYKKGMPQQNGTLDYLELIVTADCNLKCEYCYLQNFKDGLFPKRLRDKSKIYNNFKKVINYIVEHNIRVNTIELYSGELFELPFAFDMLDYFIEQNEKSNFCGTLVVPTNMSFARDEKLMKRVESYLEKMSPSSPCEMLLSCSCDGFYYDKTQRPFNSGYVRDEIFYERIEYILKKYSFGMHTMVYSKNQDLYMKNYESLVDLYKKIGHLDKISGGDLPNMLVVRNSGWSEKELENYRKFLFEVAEYNLKNIFDNDIQEMALYFFGGCSEKFHNNNLIQIYQGGNTESCSIQSGPTIRLSDLSLVGCHRLMYDELLLGDLKVVDGKISSINSKNLTLALGIYMTNPNTSRRRCSTCPLRFFCPKPCLGESYESCGSPFEVSDSVCDLLSLEQETLYDIAIKYNLFQIVQDLDDIQNDDYCYTKRLAKQFEEGVCNYKKTKSNN